MIFNGVEYFCQNYRPQTY